MNSNNITKWPEKVANRSMLWALGYNKDDFKKYQIGIASTWSNVTPCNNHINVLAKAVEYGVNSKQCKGIIFNTITVSDGISNGNEGMKFSLISREIIANSIEVVSNSQCFDGIISIGGCDKNIPGCIIGMCKLNLPSAFIYGGTILPGKNRTDIISVFESLGRYNQNIIDKDQLIKIEKNSIIGSGSCGGMYTANSMAIVTEVLGLTLPNTSLQNAQSIIKILNCINTGKAMTNLVQSNLTPYKIIDINSLLNAMKVISFLGGSTNCYLHLLAISKTLKINLSLKYLKQELNNIPTIADLKPSGNFYISDLVNLGGIQKLLKFLIYLNIIDGNTLTITGKSLRENLKNIKINYYSKILKNLNFPIKKTNHIKILFGNISLNGSIAKISGKEGEFFFGKTKIFNSEEEAVEAIYSKKILLGTVIVIRYEGIKGGPGMREMLTPTSALIGNNLRKDVALITDGRFSGGSHGFVVGHICPEAYDKGNISIIYDNDIIIIDSLNNIINVLLSEQKIIFRKKKVKIMKKINLGILNLYKKYSICSSQGAILDYE